MLNWSFYFLNPAAPYPHMPSRYSAVPLNVPPVQNQGFAPVGSSFVPGPPPGYVPAPQYTTAPVGSSAPHASLNPVAPYPHMPPGYPAASLNVPHVQNQEFAPVGSSFVPGPPTGYIHARQFAPAQTGSHFQQVPPSMHIPVASPQHQMFAPAGSAFMSGPHGGYMGAPPFAMPAPHFPTAPANQHFHNAPPGMPAHPQEFAHAQALPPYSYHALEPTLCPPKQVGPT
jgi:hypothetical protein